MMKRTFVAMLLALPLFALAAPSAQAQIYQPPMACGGLCFKFLGGLHTHGPLFNYGPYSGYYPFEPYGPWNAQLQYTGPYPGQNAGCGWGCGGRCGLRGGCGGRIAGCGVSTCGVASGAGCSTSRASWGSYAISTFKGVFHRSHPLCNRAKLTTGCSAAPVSGCSTCGVAPTAAAPAASSCNGCSVSATVAATLQSVSAELRADEVGVTSARRER